MVELVSRNKPEEIAHFITFHELGEDSMEDLEDANTLVTPLMNYIRECKSIKSHDIQNLALITRSIRCSRINPR